MPIIEQLNDDNWESVFGGNDHASPTVFEMVPPGIGGNPQITREDVVDILYFHNCTDYPPDEIGDWDGCMVGRLRDGRFVAASGWCDYTGWG